MARELRTARLRLRPPRPEDFEDLFAVLSNPEAMRYWDTPPLDRAAAQRFLDGTIASTTSHEFIVERHGRAIGKVGCWQIPVVGYILHPDHWGQGLATEALRAALADVLATHPEVPELTADIDPRNTASARVLEKLGFHETGRARHVMQVGTEWVDAIYYALPRGDLRLRD